MDKESIKNIVIRLAGDSGDGMQLIGTELANASAIYGNDIGTLPDFPAEIRAPRGTVAGVSGFQINIGANEIFTPGDEADCLVALNPAALKSNLVHLKNNGVLIIDEDSFSDKNLKLAQYEVNPLEDHSLDSYQVISITLTSNNRKTLSELEMSHKDVDRCKNFYALGLISWLYDRPLDSFIKNLKLKFIKKPHLADANILALKGGFALGEMAEISISQSEIKPASLNAGRYRAINGNKALAYGLVLGAEKANADLFYAGYPITPASDILHELFAMHHHKITTFQAEDEIAAVSASIGASFAGNIGVTASSGPGISLKAEAINLAVMTELPLIILDIQRSGPSTGMPTKTEQSDLNIALYGRSGESPLPVIAPFSPSDCFEAAYEAIKVAITYRTPVFLLSDAFLANGSEPWRIPNLENFKSIDFNFAQNSETFNPYKRDSKTLARSFAIPGNAGFEHRIGGLEKDKLSGDVSYDPGNHQAMTHLRDEKIKLVTQEIGELYLDGNISGDVLIIGWGSTFGMIKTAINKLRSQNESVSFSHTHLRWLNPIHPDLDKVINNFKYIFLPELNLGQLSNILKAKYLKNIININQVSGLPFKITDLVKFIEKEIR